MTYPGGVQALRGLSLEVRAGEYLVLVGPSGCGKTTMLRLIAGLESPTAGRVLLDAQDATSWPPLRRDVALVFQDASLYPHLSVRENLAFGPRMQRLSRQAIRERVEQTATQLGLAELLARRPQELSGGQRRRVALGRALARRPRFLLLDEPLSGLDPPARLELRGELARLHRERPTTTVHVTHDQEEAMALGERVAVLHEGVLQQVDVPMSLYHRPANIFVAGFIGSPPMNFFPWTHEGKPCRVGVRPRDIRLGPVEGADAVAVVENVQALGHECHVVFRGGGTVVVAGTVTVQPGERVGLWFAREATCYFSVDGYDCFFPADKV